MGGRRRLSGQHIQLVLMGLIPLLAVDLATTGPAAPRAWGHARGHAVVTVRNSAVSSRAGRSTSDRRVAAAGRVRDITLHVDPGRRGLGAYSDTWGDNLVFDRNHDGNPDVLLSNHLRPWEIWLGNGHGGFTFDQDLGPGDRHNCVAADFAGPGGTPPDGRADLYCVRGANYGTESHKRNWLLIQRRDGGFDDVVRSWGAVDPSGRGRTVSVLDIRGNGRPSLFVGNAAGNLYPSLDHIYVNVGGRFVDRHTGGLPTEKDSTCSDTGDFNHDGRQDFLTCSYSLRLYKNLTTPARPVTYREVGKAEGVPQGRQADAELADLNHDGWPDLVTLRRNALTVRLNRHRAPHFSRIDFTFPLVAGHRFCIGRANGDAAPDLLVVQGLKSPTDKLQRPDWMLINSGSGTHFRPLPVPQPPLRNGRNGNGDTCAAIPDFEGGRAAWTINNGYSGSKPDSHRGYRQLVVYAP